MTLCISSALVTSFSRQGKLYMCEKLSFKRDVASGVKSGRSNIVHEMRGGGSMGKGGKSGLKIHSAPQQGAVVLHSPDVGSSSRNAGTAVSTSG